MINIYHSSFTAITILISCTCCYTQATETAENVLTSSDNSTDIPTKAECIQTIIEEIYAVSNATSISFNFSTSQSSTENKWFASVNQLKPTCNELNNSCYIDKLDPCTEYEIQVEIKTCDNQSSVKNKTIYTKLEFAPEVDPFQSKALAQSKMNVTWKLSIENNCNANINYSLSWQEFDRNAEIGEINKINITTENFIFTSKHFYQKFNICITTNLYNSQLQLISQSQQKCIISDFSSPGPPPAPVITNYSSFENQIIIQYEPIKKLEGYLDYITYSWSNTESGLDWIILETQSSEISIPFLKNCTQHNLQLRALYIDNDGSQLPSNITHLRFFSTIILPPPVISLNSTSSSELFLNLNIENTNCPHQFIIEIKSIDNCYFDHFNFTTDQSSLIVNNLKPYTTYKLISRTKTEAGISQSSEYNYSTDYKIPEISNFSWPECDKRFCQFHLFIPIPPTAPIEYNVYVNRDDYIHKNKSFEPIPNEKCQNMQSNVASIHIPELKPYTKYIIKITAITKTVLITDHIRVETKPAEPGSVENLQIECDCNDTCTEGVLEWEKPVDVNGKLEAFILNFNGVREGKNNHTGSKRVLIQDDFVYFELLELWPDFNYTFRIAAKTQDVPNLGPESEISCFKASYLPPIISEVEFNKSRVIANNAITVSISFSQQLFADSNGKILNYSIILYQQDSSPDFNDVMFWSDVTEKDKILPYRTTPNNWNPFQNDNSDDMCCEKSNTFVHCQIGCNENCVDVVGPCNGPLRSNTKYEFIIKAYTSAGFSQTKAISFQTDRLNSAKGNDSNAVGIALGITIPIIIIIICVVLLMRYRREEVNILIFRIRQQLRISSDNVTTTTEQVDMQNPTSRPNRRQ